MTPHLRPRARERLARFVVWAAGLACLLALFHRMRLATDLSDESFTIAMPYRFALGDKPFVDEVSIQQTAGLVLFPFVWLYVKLTGGSTGLVLYCRWVHLFVFKGAAVFAVYAASKRLLRARSSAIAVSLVITAFVPFSIPNPGYNIIGMTLLTAGSFLTVAAVAEPALRSRCRLLFLAGLSYGFMSVAYPPLAVGAILAAPVVFVVMPDRRLASLGAFVGGGAAAALLVLPALAFGGVAGVRHSLGWGLHANQKHTLAGVIVIVTSLYSTTPPFYPYALAGIAVAWISRSRFVVAVVVAAIALAIAVLYRDESSQYWAGNSTVIYSAILAPAVLLLARPDATLVRGAALVIVPSFAAGCAASLVSANGVNSAYVGLCATMVLYVLLAARSLERVHADPTLCLLPSLALMFVLVTRYYDYVYRDGPLASLTATVKDGPFKGIRTTPDRAAKFAEMSAIVKQFDQPGGRLLVLYEEPGYYLFSSMPPSAECVWEVPHAGQESMLAQWQAYPRGRGIVLKVKGTGQGVVDSVLAPPERRVLDTRYFSVYRDQ